MNRININQTTTWPVIYFLVAFSILWGSLPALATEKVESIEQITSGVRNPEMKKRWDAAYKKGALPPLKTLPIPSQPVSRRKAIKVADGFKVPVRRPKIADSVPIDVQVFIKDPKLTQYRGGFKIISHREGVLAGKIDTSKETFEVLYKLPQTKSVKVAISDPSLFLDYRTDVSASALQRRIILYEKEKKMPKIVSITEGSEKPYRMTLSEIGLTIVQNVQSNNIDNPPVTISYQGQSVTLSQGEEKSIGKGNKALQIHLLNSFAYNPKVGLLEGQPYFVSIIIYQ